MALTYTPGQVHAPVEDIFAERNPPFDLAADMLFAAALAPSRPLQRAFPRVKFLSVLGRTPLVMWFSRVTDGCGYTAGGERRCEPIVYHELNVLAPLQAAAFFVPGIYVTSEQSLRLGHRYGMPKELVGMTFSASEWQVESAARGGGWRSAAGARLLGAGRWLAQAMQSVWPVRPWPVRFPSGSAVRAQIRGAERVYPALVTGRLALAAPWLPRPVRLLPLGIYFRRLVMHLPAP